MKQVARDPKAVQVNLLRHQHTEIPPSKSKKKNKASKFRQEANKFYDEKPRKLQENRRFDHEHTRQDRCSKCDDTPHVEGFRCPASRYKCKNCHKVGHLSSLCFKKKESEYKRDSRQPRGQQLKVGRASVQSSSYDQFDTSSSSGDDSFCL